MTKKAGQVIAPVLSAADPSNPAEIGPRPSWQQQRRERIPVAKMFGMPRGRALVWLPHDEVARISWVKGYFEIPRLAARASPNPYFKGGRARRKLKGVAAAALIAAVAVISAIRLHAPNAGGERHDTPKLTRPVPSPLPAHGHAR
jgi:hypothetical protein